MPQEDGKMMATDLRQALTRRLTGTHVCFSEVKTGPSWSLTRGLRRVDFLAIAKSWTKFAVKGYELKTSRQDFKRDKKWRDYLGFCHQFYFVCPKGLIKSEEVDEGCGLLWVYPGGYIGTRKVAAHREIELNPMLFIYLILWRMEQRDRQAEGREWRLEFIRRDMETKDLGHHYAQFVAKKLNEVNDKLHEADVKLNNLKWLLDQNHAHIPESLLARLNGVFSGKEWVSTTAR